MTLGEIIFQYPTNIKIIIRQLEKLERKQVKENMAILFNRTCRNENIQPQFTNINPHDPAARNERFTIDYRKKLFERQIALKREQIIKLNNEMQRKYDDLKTSNITNNEYNRIEEGLKDQYQLTEQ